MNPEFAIELVKTLMFQAVALTSEGFDRCARGWLEPGGAVDCVEFGG